jgi:hypothetical protein
MTRDVDTDFRHDFNGERMDVPSRLAAGAGDPETVVRSCPQETFSDVAATRIAGAKNKDERLLLHRSAAATGGLQGWQGLKCQRLRSGRETFVFGEASCVPCPEYQE